MAQNLPFLNKGVVGTVVPFMVPQPACSGGSTAVLRIRWRRRNHHRGTQLYCSIPKPCWGSCTLFRLYQPKQLLNSVFTDSWITPSWEPCLNIRVIRFDSQGSGKASVTSVTVAARKSNWHRILLNMSDAVPTCKCSAEIICTDPSDVSDASWMRTVSVAQKGLRNTAPANDITTCIAGNAWCTMPRKTASQWIKDKIRCSLWWWCGPQVPRAFEIIKIPPGKK